MQTKRGDKSLPLFVRACLCAHTGEAFFFSPLLFRLVCLFSSLSVLFFPYMAPISLCLSPFSTLLFLPRLPPAPSHHQRRSVSYLPLASPELIGN